MSKEEFLDKLWKKIQDSHRTKNLASSIMEQHPNFTKEEIIISIGLENINFMINEIIADVSTFDPRIILLKMKLVCNKYKVIPQKNYIDFSQIYPFTTENISGYINEFDIKNKSLMTVGSSGDQIINAILYDCQDITLYDINPNSKYYIYLKLASLLKLNRKDFLEFLKLKEGKDINSLTFNKELFNEIKETLKELDKDSYFVWEELFKEYKPNHLRYALFNQDEYTKANLCIMNPYLASDEAYERTRAKIANAKITFIVGNIANPNFNRKFDNIWLSNILNYSFNLENKEIIDKIVKYLNDNGTMLMSYIYLDYEALPNFTKNISCGDILKTYHPSTIIFDGVIEELGDPIENSALIYHKK